MPKQEESRDGVPRKDKDRPSPDVERYATGAGGTSEAQGGAPLGPPREILSDRNAPSAPDDGKK